MLPKFARQWWADQVDPSPRNITVRGHAVRVKSTARYVKFWDNYSRGTWERDTFEVLDRFLDRNSYYVDIGGWIGPTVLYAAALGARMVVFEPDNMAYHELRANLRLNSLNGRVKAIHAALASRNGTAKLRSNALGNSESSLVATKVQRREKLIDFDQEQECRTLSAETAVARYGFRGATLIKIDIEGGEYGLLPHLLPALRGSKIPLFISFHAGNLGVDQPTIDDRNAVRSRENQSMLSCLRVEYDLHRPNAQGVFESVEWSVIDAEHAAGKWLWGAYLFLPQ